MRAPALALLALLCAAPMVQAQEANRAASLDELLRLVEQGRIAESAKHRQREAAFAAAKSEQQQLLNQARATRAAEEKKSEQLENAFEENEITTAELGETLSKRLGSLKELFGVLQQVSGDTRAVLESSIVAAQYPNRGQFLGDLAAKMGTAAQLASIEEIERLWFELQREMTESGKIVRFPATVVTADGEKQGMPVVRVGTFNLIVDGKYLQYNPETENVVELARQPQGKRFINSTTDLFDAQGGEIATFAIDPTRGSILALLVEAPDLRERIDQGGLVGYLIIALGVFALLLALLRIMQLVIEGGKVSRQLKSDKANPKNSLGRVLMVAEQNPDMDRETLELKLSEAILQETPRLNWGLLGLKIISVVAPLMGLLGTVTGMINTFQAITLFGTGDPKLMAGGISQALVTTVLGLTVAIPTVLLHTFVTGKSRRIVHILQEQSAGIIAERDEGK